MTATNPFRFGSLALDEAFTDREREIKELTADIVNGQDVVLFGPRRYGKSSLVLRVMQGLTPRKVLVGYCDLSTTPTKEKLAEKLSQTIYDDFASVLDRVRERTMGAFRGLRIQPQITLDPTDASVSFGFDTGHAPADVDATIEALLALPGRMAAERGRKAALVLDEFQEITEIDRDYPKLMRAVFQTQPEVAHIYLGSKRHLMRRIFNDENEPFWRSAKQMELGVIPREEFAAFLRSRFAETKRPLRGDALARMLELTGGHPYATQELAYFVWEEAGSGGGTNLDAVDRGLDRLLDSEDSHFSLVWEGSSRNERLLLVALAVEPGRPFTQGFRRTHRLPPATNVQKALASLGRRELAAKSEDGVYRLSEPFLREWLLRSRR